MSLTITLSLTGKRRTSTKASLVIPATESFSQLGFLVRIIGNTTISAWDVREMELTLSSETSLSRENWSKLYALLTSLSPTSLNLSFNGLQDAEWTSPESSLGTLFSESTFSLETVDGLSTWIQSLSAENSLKVRK